LYVPELLFLPLDTQVGEISETANIVAGLGSHHLCRWTLDDDKAMTDCGRRTSLSISVSAGRVINTSATTYVPCHRAYVERRRREWLGLQVTRFILDSANLVISTANLPPGDYSCFNWRNVRTQIPLVMIFDFDISAWPTHPQPTHYIAAYMLVHVSCGRCIPL
jgi:hypothetical protein